jgi:phosphoribosyl-ATP pyrophosphohydrolase
MADERFLATLWRTIEARRDDPQATQSYTRQLLATPHKARRKVIEEAYEVAEAQQGLLGGQDTKEHLALEAADLVYHLFVVLASAGVSPGDVYGVLEKRHGPGASPGNP